MDERGERADGKTQLAATSTATVNETEADPVRTTPSRLEIRPGTKIGRYVVRSKLGTGAVGVVLAAHDPELDREVAIKLLKPFAGDRETGRRRLQREARALAKLGHPNVVAVYEIGVHDERLYVAMEFVKGQTLGAWMQSVDEPRPWPEVLRVFAEAGRGLAAAHAVGLVHRDFKPENVMLGEDGRVRVMDFGLARAADTASHSGLVLDEAQAQVDALTQTGAVLGTPAYMPLEQFKGEPADARSDQFSFCASLYEALYGQRPFVGSTLANQVMLLTQGEIADAPKGSKVPLWLREVVVRGLASSPSARFESMSALLGALADDPAVRRKRRRLIGLVAAAIAGSAGLAWSLAPSPSATVCTDAGNEMLEVWSDDRRERARHAFVATELSYAEPLWHKVEARIDRYAEHWVELEREACRARATATGGDAFALERMRCLDNRLARFDAVVDALIATDDRTVEHVIDLTDTLPGLDACQDAGAIAAMVEAPGDPETAAMVEHARQRLRVAEAHYEAHRYEQAEAVARELLDELGLTPYWPIRAEAELQLALAHEHTRNNEAAIRRLQRAIELADAAGHHEITARALLRMTRLVGFDEGLHDRGHQLAARARSAIERLGGDIVLEAQLEHELGVLAMDEQDADEAAAHHRRAIELWTLRFGPEHPKIARAQAKLAGIALSGQDPDQARRQQKLALETMRQALGPAHPEVVVLLGDLAQMELGAGNRSESHRLHLEALEVAIEGMGADDPRLVAALHAASSSHSRRGEHDEALALSQRAVEISTSHFGPAHVTVVQALHHLAGKLYDLGRFEESNDTRERARAMSEQLAESGDHGDRGRGQQMLATGKYDEAIAHYRSLLALEERVYGPDDPHVADAVVELVRVLGQAGRKDERRALMERALDIRLRHYGAEHRRVLEIRFELAQWAYEDRRWLEAQERFGDLVVTMEQVYSPKDAVMLSMRFNMGVVERALGRYAEALERHDELLKFYREHLPREVDMIVDLHIAKGDTLRAMGLYRASEREYAVVPAILRQRDELDPERLALVLESYANVLASLGAYEDARTAYLEVHELRQLRGGPAREAQNGTDLAESLRRIGDRSLGVEPEKAYVQFVTDIQGSEEHPKTWSAHARLTGVALDLGDVAEARAALDRAVPKFNAIYDEGSIKRVELAVVEARVALHERDFESAISHQRAALARLESTPDYDVNYLTDHRVTLAQMLSLDGAHDQAQRVLADTEAELGQIYGEDSIFLAEVRRARAYAALQAGHYGEARKHAGHAIEVLAAALGPESLRLHEPLLLDAQAALLAGALEDARRVLRRLHTLLEAGVTPHSVRWADLWAIRALLSASEGNVEDAERDITRADERAKRRMLRPQVILGTTELARAELMLAAGDPKTARRHAATARELFAQDVEADLALIRRVESIMSATSG